MEKQYEGDIAGRSATLFATSHDQCADVSACADIECACVALESFVGTVGGRNGAFEFAHAPTNAGSDAVPSDKIFRIMPASGTDRLAGIHGTGGMAIEADGTHRIWFDYELG